MAIGKELTRPEWPESDCASFGSPSLNKKIWTNGPSPRSQLQISNLVSWILAFCVQESLRSPLTSAGIPIPTPASAWRQSNHIPNTTACCTGPLSTARQSYEYISLKHIHTWHVSKYQHHRYKWSISVEQCTEGRIYRACYASFANASTLIQALSYVATQT